MTKTRKTLMGIWLISLASFIALQIFDSMLDSIGRNFPPVGLAEFLSLLLFVALTLYWLTVAVRYILRKLFWRVGRRLALSYILIGVLPFFLFAILLTILGYSIGGVLSQATYRSERQQALTRMDQWNLEYALGANKPANAHKSLEIYDVAAGAKSPLPEWLSRGSFTGLAIRGKEGVLVSARLYEDTSKRHSVVFVQPLNREWAKRMEAENGMIVSYSPARSKVDGDGGIQINEKDTLDGDMLGAFFPRAWQPNGVIWGDLTPPLIDWKTGDVDDEMRLFSFLWNPWSNLIEYYFGGAQYAQVVLSVMGGIALSLLLIYLPASMLAIVLIFSISRAVNRIEKGTHAVERGDFTYRINMKPRNQLGQMAQSFDTMTESISGLLVKVAEKERLQSEIDIAASIQRNLFPRTGPQASGVSFSAHFEPTASIGGDYYDVFNLEKGKLAVAIGDVSGHGLSTGLVMAMVKAALSTLVEEGADEQSLFRRLNDLVLRSTDKRAFMTLGFTIFDLYTRRIRHTNAGHLYPYLLREGSPVIAIESSSLPLGVRADMNPHTSEIDLHEGDTLVYLSDGIIEAQNGEGDPFGFDQLEAILSAHLQATPADIQEAILSSVAVHSGMRPADDDRTVMILRFDQLPVLRAEMPVGSSDEVAALN